MKNLINILDLSTEEIDDLIAVANDIIANPEKYQESCKHKVLATLFFEPSTRTRLSFESAMFGLVVVLLIWNGVDPEATGTGFLAKLPCNPSVMNWRSFLPAGPYRYRPLFSSSSIRSPTMSTLYGVMM